MRSTTWIMAVFAGLAIMSAPRAAAQPPGGRGPGGFVPGQRRPLGDPVQIERGKTLYGIACRGCHGADFRGGDMGGPNLLRSQAALSDREGELIVPIIQGSRQGMPAINMKPEDAGAVAAYVRSVMETIGRQGSPPATGVAPVSVVTGDARAGQSYFDAKCAQCHSPAGDLKGLATRISDPKLLQNTWVSGGRRGRRGPQGEPSARAVATAVVTQAGEKVEGRLVRIDDFLVTLALPDESMRTFRRDAATPAQVEVRDPLKAHADLLPVYTDKDMHDVTAYLVTLK